MFRVVQHEWEQNHLELPELTNSDREFAGALAAEGKLCVEEMKAGLRVKSRSWVGLVRFSAFEVEIKPKLTGEYLGLVPLLEYVNDLGQFRQYASHPEMQACGDSLFDLISLFFVSHCEFLMRRGLIEDYRQFEGGLPYLRGRLLADRQVLERFGLADRVICRYEDRTGDIPENQILAAASEICSRRTSDYAVLNRVNRLRTHLFALCSPHGVNLQAIRQEMVYNRLNRLYQHPHHFAWLILGASGFKDLYQTGTSACFSFLIDMNRLFEMFLEKWLYSLFPQPKWELRAQHRDSAVIREAPSARSYATVRPDLLLVANSPDSAGHRRKIPIDAKYKLYDEKGTNTADIYQAFLYSFAFDHADDDSRIPGAMIIYPESGGAARRTLLEITSSSGHLGGQLAIVGIDLSQAVEEATSQKVGPQAERVIAGLKSLGMEL